MGWNRKQQERNKGKKPNQKNERDWTREDKERIRVHFEQYGNHGRDEQRKAG